ncbi:MAG: ZIP family metal transporter [Candidatus Micrarchaeota archaeon]
MLFEILISTILISLISLVGVFLVLLNKKTVDKVIYVIISLAAGALLATVFYELLPEAIENLNLHEVFPFTLLGLVFFFILEKFVHWHHGHSHHPEKKKPIAYLILAGDGIHNFFDGIAIAASYLVSFELGVTTTIAVAMHEIPHEISDFAMLLHGGFSRKMALFWNLLSALTAVVGGLIFFYLSGIIENISYYGLAFTAGTFIYISCAALLPELHEEKDVKKSIIQVMGIVVGAIIIILIVSGHSH